MRGPLAASAPSLGCAASDAMCRFSNLHPLLGESRVWALLAEYAPLVWLDYDAPSGSGTCCFERAGAERVFDGLAVGPRRMAMHRCYSVDSAAARRIRARVARPPLATCDAERECVLLVSSTASFGAFWSRFSGCDARNAPSSASQRDRSCELRATIARIRARAETIGELVDCCIDGVRDALAHSAPSAPRRAWLLGLRYATPDGARRARSVVERVLTRHCRLSSSHSTRLTSVDSRHWTLSSSVANDATLARKQACPWIRAKLE